MNIYSILSLNSFTNIESLDRELSMSSEFTDH